MDEKKNTSMFIYEAACSVPDYAQKRIQAGRLKGMTDISPMWRIEKLTELFGPCGTGWWYTIEKQWLENGSEDQIMAFCNINLFYMMNGAESKAIPGTGGSSFITKEKNGLYTSDEAFKMALTDAISVAAKALGIGADIYMGTERDKYTSERESGRNDPPPPPDQEEPEIPVDPDGFFRCTDCKEVVKGRKKKDGTMMSPKEIAVLAMNSYGVVLCADCLKKRRAS